MSIASVKSEDIRAEDELTLRQEQLYRAVIQHLESGHRVVLTAQTKQPVHRWRNDPVLVTPENAAEMIKKYYATGFAIIPGLSSGIVNFDIDDPDLLDPLEAKFKAEGIEVQYPLQSTGKGYHFAVRCPGMVLKNKEIVWLRDETQESGFRTRIEIDATVNHLAMRAPSLHPKGHKYKTLRGQMHNPPVVEKAILRGMIDSCMTFNQKGSWTKNLLGGTSLDEASRGLGVSEKELLGSKAELTSLTDLGDELDEGLEWDVGRVGDPADNGSKAAANLTTEQRRMIVDFNKKHQIRDILLSKGYRATSNHSQLKHPSERNGSSVSLLTNNCSCHFGTNDSLVNSRNGSSRSNGTLHSPFSATCDLEFGGDSIKCLQHITKHNDGDPVPPPEPGTEYPRGQCQDRNEKSLFNIRKEVIPKEILNVAAFISRETKQPDHIGAFFMTLFCISSILGKRGYFYESGVRQ